MRHVALAVLMAALTHILPARAADAIRCEGAFGRDAGHADLVKQFGTANLEFSEIDGPEGTRQMATVLFPGTPARRLEVIWRDSEKRAQPAEIWIRRKSNWTAPGGVRLGQGVADIEKRNGAKLKLSQLD